MPKKLSFEDVKKQFDIRGYMLLETTYINNSTKMKYICPHHPDEDLSISLNKLKLGRGCKFCKREKVSKMQRTSYLKVKEKFKEMGFLLLSDTYKNKDIPLKCVCCKHLNITQWIPYNSVRNGVGCKYCHFEKQSGEGNWNWKGGITDLRGFLRNNINNWKNECVEKSNGKCIITNESYDVIHHLYSFNEIVMKSLEELSIPLYDSIYKYTQQELELLKQKCLEIHYRYPLGVCLTNTVHNLFHSNYGYGNNTPKQFEEFKQRYITGEFDQYIKQAN